MRFFCFLLSLTVCFTFVDFSYADNILDKKDNYRTLLNCLQDPKNELALIEEIDTANFIGKKLSLRTHEQFLKLTAHENLGTVKITFLNSNSKRKGLIFNYLSAKVNGLNNPLFDYFSTPDLFKDRKNLFLGFIRHDLSQNKLIKVLSTKQLKKIAAIKKKSFYVACTDDAFFRIEQNQDQNTISAIADIIKISQIYREAPQNSINTKLANLKPLLESEFGRHLTERLSNPAGIEPKQCSTHRDCQIETCKNNTQHKWLRTYCNAHLECQAIFYSKEPCSMIANAEIPSYSEPKENKILIPSVDKTSKY